MKIAVKFVILNNLSVSINSKSDFYNFSLLNSTILFILLIFIFKSRIFFILASYSIKIQYLYNSNPHFFSVTLTV